jgi:hypothetical protein
MAIKSSGQLSFSEIVAEFADTQPYSMSEFYRGGIKVPTNNINVPTSGAISFSNFYNAVNRITAYITYSSNQQQITVNPTTASGYVAGITDVIIQVNSGIYIWSDSTSTPAITINGGLATGDTLTLVNDGFIMGKGGTGGNGTTTAGGSGGPAISLSTSLQITNNSFIGGGGGGGSHGGGGGAGGGNGGFAFSGSGGVGQAPGLSGTNGSGECGGAGGRIMPGVGGAGTSGGGQGGGAGGGGGGTGTSAATGGNGGSGGNPGNNGSGNSWGGGGGGWGAAGRTGYYFGFGLPSGGTGGKAINLNGHSVTYITTGTIYGAVS